MIIQGIRKSNDQPPCGAVQSIQMPLGAISNLSREVKRGGGGESYHLVPRPPHY